MLRADKDKTGRLDFDVHGMYRGADGEIYRTAGDSNSAPVHVDISRQVIEGSMVVLRKSLACWFDTFCDLEKQLGVDVSAALRAAGGPKGATTKRREPALHWQRPPGGWWMQ